MRAVIVGAGQIAVETARLLLGRGHQVVMIERSRERIDDLQEGLDCSFLQGDGSKPDVLKQAGPNDTDILFCLADSDQANIIASVVGRSLGYDRVVTRIQDTSYEAICIELSLENTIIPSRTIGRYLADMAEGVDVLELSTVIRGEARFFTFVAGKEQAGPVSELGLPAQSRAICLYREDEFQMVDEDTTLTKGDEVVVLARAQQLPELRERFNQTNANRSSGEDGEGGA